MVQTGAPKTIFQGHEKSVTCIHASSGNILYSGSYDRTVRSWDVESGECKAIYSNASDNWILSIAVKEDEGLLFCAGYERAVNIIDLRSGKKVGSLKGSEKNPGHSKRIESIAIFENRLYTASADCTIRAWNIQVWLFSKKSG